MTTPGFSRIALTLALLLVPLAMHGQIQHNGTVPIAPQPADMPAADPHAPFVVTAVTYAAAPPNDHYSVKLLTTSGGKAFGFLEPNIGIIYSSAAQTLDFSNQFTAGGAAGLQVLATDGQEQAGINNAGSQGARCFVQAPSGFSQDSRFNFPTGSTWISTNVFATNYGSGCAGVDNGTAVGTAYNEIFTETPGHAGILSQLTGYSQTAFAGGVTLGDPTELGHFLQGCCSRARAIKGNQVVGDTSAGGDLPLPGDPLGLDSLPAGNPNSIATLWLLSAPSQAIALAGPPSVALATNGSLQGGWAGSHAVIWSGSRASLVDLNPPGYFDSRVTGISTEFQVGDGWLGGPANSPGAVRHALLWKGSAASVIDLNQLLPASIQGASINGVDADGNIVGSMIISSGQELGLYFQPNPAASLASFIVSSANPAPGDTVMGTVALQSPAAPGGVTITFTTDNPSLAAAPASVTIPAGQAFASFNIPIANTFVPGQSAVMLTAHDGLTVKTASIGVTTRAPSDALTSFTLGAASAGPGDTVTMIVTLAAAAPAGGAIVNFASSNPAVAPAPASVTIPQGAASASTSIVLNASTLFQPVTLALEAQTGSVTLSANLTVASPSKPVSVQLGNPQNALTSTQGNSTGTGFVAFTSVAQAPGTVILSSSNPALIVPPSVSFAMGQWLASFNYTALPTGALATGTLSATANGVTVSTNISVTPSPSPTVQSLAIPLTSPTKTFSSGQTLTGTITLSSPAFLGGMTVVLSTDSPTAVQIPASVTLASNTTSASFPVAALAVSGPTQVSIAAAVPGLTPVTAGLTVIPGPALSIASLTLAPYSMIGPGVTTSATVTINQPAPAGGISIALSDGGSTAAKLPSSVSIPAGQSSATVTIQGNSVGSAASLSLLASYTGPLAPLGAAASAPLTVAPSDSLRAPKPTWSSSTHLLTTTCTSTNPQAVINVFNAAGNVLLGTMTNLGNGNYSFQTTVASVSSVNFKSNLGGATGQGVTVVP